MLKDKYFFFWRASSPLSNWHEASYELDGIIFPTSEHGLMYVKAQYFEDEKMMKEIPVCGSARKAKSLGRKVKGFDAKLWSKNSADLFFPHLVAKFEQNPDLKKVLLETAPLLLAEASPYDRIWGIGYRKKDAINVSKKKWGENRLGKLLVRVRDQLMKS